MLHGYKNDNGVYSLYVTDYTRNECITPVQAPWCHPKLQDNVLKVEMWEEAAELGAKMTAGDYFSMGNVRMKVSSGGYVEGTISDRKIRRLDVDELEHEPHLADLLG